MKKIATIVPSRGRPNHIIRLHELFFNTSIESDLYVVIDQDEIDLYPALPNIHYRVLPQMKLNQKLNAVALSLIDKYEYIAFFGDDVEPRTYGWDEVLIRPLRDNIGISYGNDLLQEENLPNNVVISSQIIKELGFMAPTTLKHFYIDNFWKELGLAINRLYYNPNVILEHMHPLNQKSDIDQTYNSGWSSLEEDQLEFSNYINKQLDDDVLKIKKILN
ncbi:MAG: hypothetical protein RLZZ328_1392 [Bacteroidota bacterium]|jgi:hypothetical protein